jgi:hypothetical protein
MFTEEFKHRLEKFITYFGIGIFIVHFSLIIAIQFGLISGQYFPDNLFGHPFASLFSPFSILLIYEVYLLIYYLRKSYTRSVAKQLEIMALILLRNSFKDIGKMMQGQNPLLESDLIKDLSGFVLVLLLLWVFYTLESKRTGITFQLTANFIRLKERLSSVLLLIFLGLSIYSFSHWTYELVKFSDNHAS